MFVDYFRWKGIKRYCETHKIICKKNRIIEKFRCKNHTFLQFCSAPGPFLSKFRTCHFRGRSFEMVENFCRKILSFQGIKLEINQCLRSDKGSSSPTTLPSQEQTVQDRHRLSTNLTVNEVFFLIGRSESEFWTRKFSPLENHQRSSLWLSHERRLTVVCSCGHEHVIAHLIMSSFGLKRTLLFPFWAELDSHDSSVRPGDQTRTINKITEGFISDNRDRNIEKKNRKSAKNWPKIDQKSTKIFTGSGENRETKGQTR